MEVEARVEVLRWRAKMEAMRDMRWVFGFLESSVVTRIIVIMAN